jgi:hypothetical protein
VRLEAEREGNTMPKQKDLKRLVRSRMQKTGESYTTARSHLIAKNAAKHAKNDQHAEGPAVAEPRTVVPTATAARARAAALVDYAALAGMSDAAVEKATGCRWDRWVRALDNARAYELPHRDIARLVEEKYKIGGWWAQSVTGGYERIRGLREKGQRRGGGYMVNKSKTIAVPLRTLYRAFATSPARRRWLGDAKVTVKKATAEKTIRFLWSDGTHFEASFQSKGAAKSQVQLQHHNLPTRAAADEQREYWSERLAVLAGLLSEK